MEGFEFVELPDMTDGDAIELARLISTIRAARKAIRYRGRVAALVAAKRDAETQAARIVARYL